MSNETIPAHASFVCHQVRGFRCSAPYFFTMALFIAIPVSAQQIEETAGASAELALSNDTLDVRYLAKRNSGGDGRFSGGVSSVRSAISC